jgi:hypothetical protein
MRLKQVLVFLFLLVPLLSYGCAKSYRAHPELESRVQNIKNPGLIPPDVKIYEFSAGGVTELRDDWCTVGTGSLLTALTDCFEGRNCKITCLVLDKETQEELEDVKALYRAVTMSIQLHTYPGPQLFAQKQKNFDYSVGSIEGLLERMGADALVFVYGQDEISTTGRKALMVLGAIASGVTGVQVMPRPGITIVSIALVDPSGDILWFSVKGSQGGHDLRERESATELVKSILVDFPALGQ